MSHSYTVTQLSLQN